MKSLIPVVMAGILGIYGMIVAVILSQKGNSIFTQLKKTGSTLIMMVTSTWHQASSADSVAW